MRAWCLPAFGTIESLSLETVPDVPPGPDEVLLDVLSAALNPADRYLAEGLYPAKPRFPHVLGRDGLGMVVRVGAGVAGWKPGDKALLLRGEAGVSRPGTLAERVTVPADCLEPVPAGWTDDQASCAALVYVTAHQALTQWGDLPPGVVLVSGASGGVGVATVQLATAAGHTVVALSRSPEKAERIAALGAALVLDPAEPQWRTRLKEFLAPRRVDLVVDTIGGELLPRLIDTLGMGGRVSLVGMLAGPVPQLNTASFFFRRIRMGGVAVGTYSIEESRAAWRQVVALLGRTGQRPIIDSVFPLEEVPAAFARLAAGPMGKVLVRVGAGTTTAAAGPRAETHGGDPR
jgi:NADPH2:quinone reductase